MKSMKIKNKGFTLIELMVTVVIIGILGAVAVPAYQDYTIRAQVTEGISLLGRNKLSVTEYYQNHGFFPSDMETIGMVSSHGSFIKETYMGDQGVVGGVFGNESNYILKDKYLEFIPVEKSGGILLWECDTDINSKYLPSNIVCNYDADEDSNIPEQPEYPGMSDLVPTGSTECPSVYGVEGYTKEESLGLVLGVEYIFESCLYNGMDHNPYGPALIMWRINDNNEKTTIHSEYYYIMGYMHRNDGPAEIFYNEDGSISSQDYFLDYYSWGLGLEVDVCEVIGNSC